MKRNHPDVQSILKMGAEAFLLSVGVYILLTLFVSLVMQYGFAGAPFPPLLKYLTVIISSLIGPYFHAGGSVSSAVFSGVVCGVLMALVFWGFGAAVGMGSVLVGLKKSAFVILMCMAGAFLAKMKNGFSF